MAIGALKTKDIQEILKAVPRLVKLPARRMSVDYDLEADVLYLGFRKPQKASDSELRDDGVILHRRGKILVGITILEASKR